MKPFRERNPVVIGVIGIAVIALMMLGAFRADRLPIIGSGDTYHAEFAEIGALKSGNEVRVAGVSVGKVKDIELRRQQGARHVQDRQGHRRSAPRPAPTSACVRCSAPSTSRSPPRAPASCPRAATIPLERTIAPYDVVQAFSELSKTTDQIDVPQLSKALEHPRRHRGQHARGVPRCHQGRLGPLGQPGRPRRPDQHAAGQPQEGHRRPQLAQRRAGDAVQGLRRAVPGDQRATRLDPPTAGLDPDDLGAAARTRQGHPGRPQAGARSARRRDRHAAQERGEPRRGAAPYPGFLRVFSNALGTGPWFDTYLGGLGTGGLAQADHEDALGGGNG